EDRAVFLHIEPEPVEAGFPLVTVVEVIDVVSRTVDVAPEDQLVGVLPIVVRLALEGGAIVGFQWDAIPLDSNWPIDRTGARFDRETRVTVAGGAVRQVHVGIAGMKSLGELVPIRALQLHRDGVIGGQSPARRRGLDAISLSGLEVLQREGR